MRATPSIVLSLIAAAIVSGCSTTEILWDEKVSDTRTLSIEHEDDASLYVDSRNGSVEVYADDTVDTVEISAKVTAADTSEVKAAQRLAETKIVAERDAARQLTVKPVWPTMARGGEGASFSIRLPDANGVTIDTSNGSVTVHGMRGRLVVDSSNGSVEVVNQNGETIIDSSNGTIEVTGNRGRVYADTSNGRVRIVDQHGPVEVDTSNGNIEVVLADDQTGPLRLDSSNGSITVTVGPAFGGTVEFDTSNGRIVLNNRGDEVVSTTIEKSDGVIVLRNPGERSVIDTSNANITFTIKSETATTSASD